MVLEWLFGGDDDSQKNDSQNNTPQNDAQSDENSEDERKKQEQEEKKKEDEEKEEEFHPHKGKILGIKPYTHIGSLSWDKSYDNPTGTSKVTLHYDKQERDEMVKFVYKGASCKTKIRRSNEPQFKTTTIEEYGLSEDEIHQVEHYPTKEQQEEADIYFAQQDLLNSQPNESEVIKLEKQQDETKPYTRSDNDGGLYGFITDVVHDEKGTELEVKDWGYCLEDNTIKLSFNNMLRSQILEEVIKSYGLVPVVDFTGLKDDNISWSNVTQSSKKTTKNSQTGDDTTDLKKSGEWDDSTTSHDLSGYDTRTVYYAGHIPPDEPKYYESIGDPNSNYANFVKGCTTPEEVMKKLRPKAVYCSYADNRDNNAKTSFNNITSPGLNCGDSARLVKCCMDVCGIPCIVIHVGHVATAPYGHYYNAVKKNGKWVTTDLCRVNDTIKKKTMTQQLGV